MSGSSIARNILPLLDGLDEVRKDARDVCVAAINRYQSDHGLDLLAVCCRKADYDALEARLDLRTAVVAEPLTYEQIDIYLAAGGAPLAALRTVAREDEQMQGLLSTPLMLSVVALAYEGKDADTIPTPNEDRKLWAQAVFHDYVPTILARRFEPAERKIRKDTIAYSEAETTRYLAWLAAQMQAHGQMDSSTYVERLRPDWLPNDQARGRWRTAARWVYGLVYGLGGGMVFGVGGGLVYGLVYGILSGLAYGLGGGVVFGLVVGCLFTLGRIGCDSIL